MYNSCREEAIFVVIHGGVYLTQCEGVAISCHSRGGGGGGGGGAYKFMYKYKTLQEHISPASAVLCSSDLNPS